MKGRRGREVVGQLRAIIYVLLGQPHSDRWIEQCRAWVEEKDYRLTSLIEERPDDGHRPGLADGIQMLMDDRADVMVVATTEYLPTDWVPRIEVAWDWAGDEPFALRRVDPVPHQRRARPSRPAEK